MAASWVAIAAVIGLAVGWLLRAGLARRASRQGRQAAITRATPSVVEAEFIRKEVGRLRSVEAALAAAEVAKEGAVAQAATMRQRLDELEGMVVEAERWERSLAAERAQRAAVYGKMTEAIQARDRTGELHRQATERVGELEEIARRLTEETKAQRERSQQQVTESEIARALVATELMDLKKRLAVRDGEEAKLRREVAQLVVERTRLVEELGGREAQARAAMVRHQTDLALRDTRIGGLEAEASRVAPLRRQVEDREVLLRSLAEERDQAMATVLERERDLIDALERSGTIADQERRAAAKILEQATTIANLREAVITLTKEREDRTGATVRVAGEIDTLKAELRDRDLRFQALLADRRAAIEANLAEIRRLREKLVEATRPSRLEGIQIGVVTNGHTPDDLKRISGIGPAIEKLLHAQGITTFFQIATWSDDDIARVATELGAFRDRIHRDHWVEQARLQLQALHKDSAA